MFAMDWITALITMLLTGCLYLYIFYRKPGLLLTFCKFLLMYFILQRQTGEALLKLKCLSLLLKEFRS